tara:strand:- start:74 stop:280 length:207 start_codon:yes stop_codon:yes gene_type:complete
MRKPKKKQGYYYMLYENGVHVGPIFSEYELTSVILYKHLRGLKKVIYSENKEEALKEYNRFKNSYGGK